jgi:hypothetical protein
MKSGYLPRQCSVTESRLKGKPEGEHSVNWKQQRLQRLQRLQGKGGTLASSSLQKTYAEW